MHLGFVVENLLEYRYVICVISMISFDGTIKKCTGIAIQGDTVITCAHCLTDRNDEFVKAPQVRFAWSIGFENFTYIVASEIHPHPDYAVNNHNDIAVGKVGEMFPSFFPNLGGGIESDCNVFLYGAYDEDPRSFPFLHMKQIHPVPHDKCNASPMLLCSYVSGSVAPCGGDSGGPLICGNRLVGILSHARYKGPDKCGEPKNGIVFYESISGHANWINKHTTISVQGFNSVIGFPTPNTLLLFPSVSFLLAK